MYRRRILLGTLLVGLTAASASGQRPPNFFPPGFGQDGGAGDPNAFFDRMFGGEMSEEERRRWAEVEVPRREEDRWGEQMVETALRQIRDSGIDVSDDGPDVAYLQRLIALIHPQLANADRYRRFRVYVIETSAVDAMSYPGGTLFVSRGMLDFCENEAALVGVLGHEMSHVDRGHQLWPLKQQIVASEQFSGNGFDPRRMMETFSQMSRMWSRPFRPEEETDADLDGATWTFRAGYDPRELAQLFLRLSEQRADGADNMPPLFRSHPFDADRYRAIMDRYEELREEDPDRELIIDGELRR